MKKSTVSAVLVVVVAAGCQFETESEAEIEPPRVSPDETPKAEPSDDLPVLISQADMRTRYPRKVSGCEVGLSVELWSGGESGLEIKTHEVPLKGCENVRIACDIRRFSVVSTEFDEGVKQYYAEGIQQAVILTDRRAEPGNTSGVAWTLVLVPLAEPQEEARAILPEYFAQDVETTRVPASGENRFSIVIGVGGGMDLEVDWSQALYPHEARVEEVAFTNSAAVQLVVVDDHEPLHVLSQVRALSFVDSAALAF